jgi:hypothetical protein
MISREVAERGVIMAAKDNLKAAFAGEIQANRMYPGRCRS